MAFKMKGSAFKLNNVATKSALKQGWKPTPTPNPGDRDENFDHPHSDHHTPRPPGPGPGPGPNFDPGPNFGEPGPPMKSPLEQNEEKFTKTESKAKKSDVQPKPVKNPGKDPQGPTDPSEFTFAMKSPMKDIQRWGIDQSTGGWDSDWGAKDSHNKKHKRDPEWDHAQEEKDAEAEKEKERRAAMSQEERDKEDGKRPTSWWKGEEGWLPDELQGITRPAVKDENWVDPNDDW